ncbi:polysaccharide biosynthesis/export family protein [Vibrio panuliri]|uniref:Capsular biosynthesis protein n=1 Tax=Vibrio panuliri TaxID=1381081 RepID=A0A1Q9HN05_9VIBR|nr:polysaccharide biosynthesis/export family protein [Vibrio panuliri]KAB1457238.1 polysaccharide export protein [Vibrio panuliri]OLQ92101.1 capsular biosynthesis protein [Vibrio panuliri]OLQ92510.1 capsular biosynthesis protein [Vibrio panuliri]
MSHTINAVLLTLLFILAPFKALAFQDTYIIGAGDKIQISVYGEEELSIEELYINNSGKFEYPYLGELVAINKTPEQLKNEITNGLRGDYLISPKVRVSITEFRSIYVNGEVKKPGGYEYQPGLTVDKAIALAGGFTDRAARSKISISQAGSESKNRVKLSSKVLPGDIIVIEQSFF